ncbi:MAG: hypothetical protein ACLU4N_03105 [Butyricimonas faecihominis]
MMGLRLVTMMTNITTWAEVAHGLVMVTSKKLIMSRSKFAIRQDDGNRLIVTEGCLLILTGRRKIFGCT